MRLVWCLAVVALGCARTSPLCHDDACVLEALVDAGTRAPARDGGFAAQVAYLKAQNTEAGDAFGTSVALSGDGKTIAVGAPGEDSRAPANLFDNRASASGAVFVFVHRDGAWHFEAYLKAASPRQGDHFGQRLALSRDGDTLAISAVDEGSDATGIDQPRTTALAPKSGAVFIFTRERGAWSQHAYVKASNTGADDAFGASVSLSAGGDTLIIGAPGEGSDATGVDGDQTNDRAPGRGAVYVFRRDASGWAQARYLKPRTTTVTGFGFSTALSATAATLVVQSAGDGGVITALSTSALQEEGSTQAATSFESVAIDAAGDVVASAELTQLSGRVRVFQRQPSWAAREVLEGPAGAGFGEALALSADGLLLAVGHPGDASRATGVDGPQRDTSMPRSGAVRLFLSRAGAFTPHAYVKPNNTNANDAFGSSVAVSDDGAVLAVGAPGEASAAIGVGGTAFNNSAPGAGAVYVFSVER